jgi:peptide deformylase
MFTVDHIYEETTDMKAKELPINIYPDPSLHMECEDITRFDDKENFHLQQLFINMAYTMVKNNGIGIAAPQVGVFANLIVLLVQNPGSEKPGPLALINPKIISSSKDVFKWEEGCLSVPGFYEERERPKTVVVQYKTLAGEDKEMEFNGLYAFSVQHEIDHLHGQLFIDNLSVFKRKFSVEKKIKKYLKSKR